MKSDHLKSPGAEDVAEAEELTNIKAGDMTCDDVTDSDAHDSALLIEDNLRKARRADRFGHSSDRYWRERVVQYLLEHADLAYPRLLDDLRHGVQLQGTIPVIARFSRIETIAVLENLLLEGHESICEAAALALGAHPQKEALDALIHAVESKDPNRQSAALAGLEHRGDAGACSKFNPLLNSTDASMRWLTLHALGNLRCIGKTDLTRLAESDSDKEVRRLAALLGDQLE